MEDKINIAELLHNCPQGMELDCVIFENVVLDEVNFDKDPNYPIRIVTKSGTMLYLSKYGTYIEDTDSKCVIFPKGKTTWEGFVPPCRFKDGDILFVDCSDEEDKSYQYIFILNKPGFYGKWHSYCHLNGCGYFHSKETFLTDEEYYPRLATEEEKQKLFDAIKTNGYRWNAETKTLEKLVEPKFKVGDRVKHISAYTSGIVVKVTDKGYHIDYPKGEGVCYISFTLEKDYELAPNKFDITTLKPFKSKVLVRDDEKLFWRPAIFGLYKPEADRDFPYIVVGGTFYTQCIPYEGNEHLLGTTNDCDNFYKTWEK